MDTSGFVYILVALVLVDAADSHRNSRGLSCLNDYVNKVSCTWNGPPLDPGLDCRISSEKNSKRRGKLTPTCKVEQHADSPPGCSFVFKNQEFNCYKNLTYIRMECDGKLVDKLTNYTPCHHIKMHPPEAPSVNCTAGETNISWRLGSPSSIHLKDLNFQVQSKQEKQTWEEALNLTAVRLWLTVPSWKLKGRRQVRVRVYPGNYQHSHWSDWSPVTSWEGEADREEETSRDKGWSLDKTFLMIGVMFSLVLILVTLGLYRTCVSKRFRKEKTVPSPSKYFHTLHSEHGGNLKMWLNPLAVSESFFTSVPDEHISSIALCKSTDVLLCASPFSGSTGALLHLKSCHSAGSDTSGVADSSTSSSSSSSHFSNMGYFLSSSSGCSTQTQPNPAYFTYQDEFQHLHQSHHVRLCPSFTAAPAYEGLVSEPQSPDSGFDIQEEDEEFEEGERVVNVEMEAAPDDHTSPLLVLPLHLPSQVSGPSSPLPWPDPPCLSQGSSADTQQEEAPVLAKGGSYAAWPQAGAMCRSSSMPVEPSKTGYLTLKELQTTFSNKSI